MSKNRDYLEQIAKKAINKFTDIVLQDVQFADTSANWLLVLSVPNVLDETIRITIYIFDELIMDCKSADCSQLLETAIEGNLILRGLWRRHLDYDTTEKNEQNT